MTWHPEAFRALFRKVCDHGDISFTDFSRLLELTRDAPPEMHDELTGLVRLMHEETAGD